MITEPITNLAEISTLKEVIPSQSTRLLQLAILNLMPTKITTERQLLRLLTASGFPLQTTFTYTFSHQTRNTPEEYVRKNYLPFEEIASSHYDGLIITGAPVEQLDFEEVDYWPELTRFMDWSSDHVRSTLHICWGAQAALYHHYGIPKYPLPTKMFGVFNHEIIHRNHRLVEGLSNPFPAPHSRHTEVLAEDILCNPNLEILAASDEAGVFLAASRDGRQIFIPGHAEYDRLTLHDEYQRDLGKGLPITMPKHYYPDDNPENPPVMTWREDAGKLFANWLRYFVTPH